jgi:sugar-specific transcriptional regulator TrmB
MPSQRQRAYTEHLTALGLSEVEADVYVFLLGESPATGYRVSQGTGRTAANTYKAIEALEARGAVMVEEAESRLCRAVPVEELLGALESNFRQHRTAAAEALADVTRDYSDDRVYQLKTPIQIYERCRAILQKAKKVVLIDAFPEPLVELLPYIRAALDRGVRMAVLAYDEIDIPGATVIVHYKAKIVRSRWPAHWINIAADSEEYVNALLTPDRTAVVHAVWSASPFMAHLYHSGLLGELAMSATHGALASGKSAEEVRVTLEQIGRFEHQDTPAFAALTQAPLRRGARRSRDTQ